MKRVISDHRDYARFTRTSGRVGRLAQRPSASTSSNHRPIYASTLSSHYLKTHYQLINIIIVIIVTNDS